MTTSTIFLRDSLDTCHFTSPGVKLRGCKIEGACSFPVAKNLWYPLQSVPEYNPVRSAQFTVDLFTLAVAGRSEDMAMMAMTGTLAGPC